MLTSELDSDAISAKNYLSGPLKFRMCVQLDYVLRNLHTPKEASMIAIPDFYEELFVDLKVGKFAVRCFQLAATPTMGRSEPVLFINGDSIWEPEETATD